MSLFAWMKMEFKRLGGGIIVIFYCFGRVTPLAVLLLLQLVYDTESRAICRYLATKYKESGTDLLPAKTASEIAATEIWLEVESQQFFQPIYKICFELLIKPMLGMVTDEEAAEKHAADSNKILDVYEARLSKSKYIAGEEFTLADCNHMAWLNVLMMTKKANLVTERPHLKAWWELISARPAWQKTAAAK